MVANEWTTDDDRAFLKNEPEIHAKMGFRHVGAKHNAQSIRNVLVDYVPYLIKILKLSSMCGPEKYFNNYINGGGQCKKC
ncbi:hypothetical protein MAR_002060 [Mya arenaria]|uniref:Uncharacterized protein n=1 Tax=Mya arenaria TaxID=6604 RepID=A0ABY7FF57_MYAAR|nr:hypothetical protein MAR_002060 [Mya arenaria]